MSPRLTTHDIRRHDSTQSDTTGPDMHSTDTTELNFDFLGGNQLKVSCLLNVDWIWFLISNADPGLKGSVWVRLGLRVLSGGKGSQLFPLRFYRSNRLTNIAETKWPSIVVVKSAAIGSHATRSGQVLRETIKRILAVELTLGHLADLFISPDLQFRVQWLIIYKPNIHY